MIDFLWILLILYLTYLGIKLSKKIKYKNFSLSLKNIDKEGLFVSLGTKIGVGSIIGTAMSILVGGPGTIFWIWLFTLLTSSLVYTESYLGSIYKKRINNEYLSGPYFYTKYGLKKPLLAIIITILLLTTYSHFFLMLQANTIIELLNINKYIFGTILFFFMLLTLSLEIKNLINILNKIVPIMCLIFILTGLFIIIKNHNLILYILSLILKEAFTIKGITVGLLIGIKRCVFQTELLIGTTSISSGINEQKPDNVARTQTLGSYFINFIICTITAFLILIFFEYKELNFTSYNTLLINVFSFHLGNIGELLLLIEIILFSLTTILSGFYMGISIITFLSKNKKIVLLIKLSMLTFCLLGVFINTNTIWLLIDFIMGIIIILNTYVITKLKGVVNDK